MSFAGFLGGLAFNLLGTDAVPAGDGHFHLRRPDGTVVTLLDSGPFALELGNTRLPAEDLRLGADFRELCAVPKMSTFAIGSIINAAVAEMDRDSAFVNVGVWHGYTFLAGLHGNADVRAIGIDDFSQFGGPRTQFLRRFERVAGEGHVFLEADYREAFADGVDEQIGVYVYDGPHSYDDQLESLRLAEPSFADGCVVIVDDVNLPAARKAISDFLAGSSRQYSVLLDVRTPVQHPTMWNGLLVLREGGGDDAPPIGAIPAPRLPTVEAPPRRDEGGIVALVDVEAPAESVAATVDALRSQRDADIELLAFGPPEASPPGVECHDSAVDALIASDAPYALLVHSAPGLSAAAAQGALAEARTAPGVWGTSPRGRRPRARSLEEHRQRLREFQRRFARNFGYEIRDPFDDLCTKLAADVPFAYSRYGDGEFRAIFGAEGVNCDGHPFHSDLGARLSEVLSSRPDYTLGLLPLAVRVHGMQRIHAVSDGIDWVLANTFPRALLEGRFAEFLDALAGREVLLVGPEHLHPLAEARGWAHLRVASRDCWSEYADVLPRLGESISAAGGVILFCASMMTNVLIDDLHRAAPQNTYVDVGSAFDPLCGVNSRFYHDVLDRPALAKIAVAA